MDKKALEFQFICVPKSTTSLQNAKLRDRLIPILFKKPRKLEVRIPRLWYSALTE